RSGFSDYEPYARSSRSGKGDEIDQLGESFDHMAERIVEQIDALKNENALRSEMVAHVSHDLRTPLASLHGYLETLQMKSADLTEKEQKEYLETALRQSERLRRLVAELFELAKLEAPEHKPDSEPFSATDLAQDVVQKFRLRAAQQNVDLKVEFNGAVPLVSGDVALVERVLENLIDNALNHTPSDGHIHIPIIARDGKVEFAVRDSGEGIPAEAQSRIFDRFYQVRNEHRGSGHTGLGLSIAKRIVELHDGELRVESAPGKGTTFRFALPMWREAEKR
ncbi:MAG TPA: HAMP domain-containing sensor histidine kinase, partial [Gammaproteobacteria bacterium]|nr:HAMP domain-containing sensor histidine kinase [Gammaproteobacteria bacterium]